MKKNTPDQPTKHHIDPRSRTKKGIIGVCIVPRKMHELYHQLFGNMKPAEIVEYLNKIFWDEQFEIIIKRKKS
jgi:hypothetical protein